MRLLLSIEEKSKLYGLAQTVILLVFAVVVLFGPSGARFPLGPAARTAGYVLCGIGLVLLFAAISRIGQSIQIAPAPKQEATLVTTGVYRWFRHPIYTSIVMVVLGLFLKKPTFGVATIAAVVILFLLIKVKFEERLLLARYPEYADYMRRAWGIVPWLT
jgi:protein-S-isoprenylcysteine O-methyltransferase Ste14